jgi:hypothetical protein
MVFSGVSISPKTGTLQTWHLQTCISRLQAQGIIDKAVVEYLHRRWPALSLGKLRVLHLEIPCFVFIPYIMALGEKKHGFPFFGMSKCEMCTQGIHLFLENWRTSPPADGSTPGTFVSWRWSPPQMKRCPSRGSCRTVVWCWWMFTIMGPIMGVFPDHYESVYQ